MIVELENDAKNLALKLYNNGLEKVDLEKRLKEISLQINTLKYIAEKETDIPIDNEFETPAETVSMESV